MVHFDAPAPLLPELLSLHGRWRATKPALVVDDDVGPAFMTWAELDAAANRVANALIAEGVCPGDAVAVAMGNGTETVATLLGVIKSGGVATPLNLTVNLAAIGAMISDCDARVVIADGEQAQRLGTVVGDRPRIAIGRAPGWKNFDAWSSACPDAAPRVILRDDDPINVIYSSGTTGKPKGIVHTHRRRLDWGYDLAIALRYHGAAHTLCTLPLYSNVSWVMLLCTIVSGGTFHLTRRFDAGRFLELLSTQGITHTALVPVQYQRIVDHPVFESADVTGMQAMMSCGSPLHPPLKAKLLRRFPCGVIELYGLTEGVITTLDPEEATGRVESVGRPLPGTDLKLVDELGRPVPTGTPGEIVSRGRILMTSYLNRDDASQDATWVDDDGRRWLRTGDLGRFDEYGFLYVVGRKKDMILSGGQNIYPADIESVLVTHPDVADAAVIGVPSARWGETPLAVVEPIASRTIDPEALRLWANERVGRFQRLSRVVLLTQLPRNPNGKVVKQVLRDAHATPIG